MKFIITDQGRLLKTSTGFENEYFIKDHLGNNRVTVKESNGSALVMQEDHYDPFGFALGGQSYQNPLEQAVNKYLYNGKEMQDDLGLDWYDYGARFYDATLGRWWAVDPKCEKYYTISPYDYCANNPIKFIDQKGEEIIIYYMDKKTGEKTNYTYNPDKKYEGSNTYIKQVEASLSYISKGSETGKGIINELAKADNFKVTIVQTDELKIHYNSIAGQIEYNTKAGLLLDKGIQSPAVGLIHELGHAKNVKNEGRNVVSERNTTSDAQYDNKEDRKVITEVEQPVVKELNQNGASEAERRDHSGKNWKVQCPTCTY